MFDLYNYSLLLIFAVGLLVILGLSEIGWQLGVRAEGKGGSNLATLESAMLGLLALMIAFTFSMALSRFDARRDAVLNEANAIGTTALRARLLPEPHRADTLKLLTEYVQIRLDIVRTGASLAERMAVVDRSNALQEALWQQAKAMASKDKRIDTDRTFYRVAQFNDRQSRKKAGGASQPGSKYCFTRTFRNRRCCRCICRLRERARCETDTATSLRHGSADICCHIPYFGS